MKLNNFLKKRGSQAALARELGVSPVLVHQWAMELRPVPISRCLSIEQKTLGKVKRKDLRPTDFKDIWPDLA